MRAEASQNYAQLYPSVADANCTGGLCRYISSPNATQFAHTADARIDYHIGEKDSLFGRYSINDTNSFIPPLIPAVKVAGLTVEGSGANFNTLFPSTAYQRQQSVAMGYTHIFSPTLLMQLNAQVFRYVTDSEALNHDADNVAFGGPANINSNFPGSQGLALAWFTSDGYNALGDAFALPTVYHDTGYQYAGSINWTKGGHSIKIGESLVRRDWTVFQHIFKAAYMFGNSFTGNSFAALLNGTPTIFLRTMDLTAPQYRAWESGSYIQDDWRVNHWLTLNLGLRYDIFTPFKEKHNHLSNFDPTDPTTLAGGKVILAGQNGVSDTLNISTQLGDIQPRFGFAASLGHGTVVRGGYALSYAVNNMMSPSYLNNAPYTATSSAFLPGWTAAPALVPDSTCLVPSCGATGSNAISTAYTHDPHWTKVHMFNVTLEKEFKGNLLSLAYVGVVTRELPRVVANIDMPLPPMGPGGCGQTTSMSLPSPCQPYYKQLPNTSSIQLVENNGIANFNDLEIVFQRRLSKGLTLSSNYTLQRNLTDVSGNGGSVNGMAQIVGDWSHDYGPAASMQKHRFVITALYALPFGRDLKGFAKIIGQGWQVNGIYLWSSGTQFTVMDALSRQNTGISNGGADRPNLIRGQGFTKSPDQWFDTTQFQAQPMGTAGSEGTNCFAGPPQNRIDLSMFKEFALRERTKLQFRLESFNFTNTPQFGNPTSTFTGIDSNNIATKAANFGKIVSTYSPNRSLQFALKLVF